MRVVSIAAAFLLAATAATGEAAVLRATPATLDKVLDQAKGGDTIQLGPGAYAGIQIAKRHFSPDLVIDAKSAKVSGFLAEDVSGLVLRGGSYVLPPPVRRANSGQMVYGVAVRLNNVEDVTVDNVSASGPGAVQDAQGAAFGDGYGVFVLRGRAVKINGSRFQGFKSGVVLSRVDSYQVLSNTFLAMRSDGIQAGESRNGLIQGNQCAGTRPLGEDHPDCIQLWSRPTSPPTADVVIRENRADGQMQGISLFNHVRDGVDDGGFDRITIENNDLHVAFPHGVAVVDARSSVVRNNMVRTVDGARWRASINLTGEILRCGNSVDPGAGKPGLKDPPCKP